MTLHNAPAGTAYGPTLTVALILNAIVLFAFVMTLLAIRAHRRDQAEEDA